jgi:hypothetical protein
MQNKENIMKVKESEGKSGSFFFFSHDNRFLIKTITQGELKTVVRCMASYYEFIKDHSDTLISKIYGVYTIQIR